MHLTSWVAVCAVMLTTGSVSMPIHMSSQELSSWAGLPRTLSIHSRGIERREAEAAGLADADARANTEAPKAPGTATSIQKMIANDIKHDLSRHENASPGLHGKKSAPHDVHKDTGKHNANRKHITKKKNAASPAHHKHSAHRKHDVHKAHNKHGALPKTSIHAKVPGHGTQGAQPSKVTHDKSGTTGHGFNLLATNGNAGSSSPAQQQQQQQQQQTKFQKVKQVASSISSGVSSAKDALDLGKSIEQGAKKAFTKGKKIFDGVGKAAGDAKKVDSVAEEIKQGVEGIGIDGKKLLGSAEKATEDVKNAEDVTHKIEQGVANIETNGKKILSDTVKATGDVKDIAGSSDKVVHAGKEAIKLGKAAAEADEVVDTLGEIGLGVVAA